ncbi:MAG TPA: Maf family protein [Syntrophales bacterium]|nr:Maf family protein [Syntrophales bacterium]HPO35359.1 Maf family protein [Syntrophales bacterium]
MENTGCSCEMTLSAPLILASASPRRRELLELLGLPFSVIPPRIDEDGEGSTDPAKYVLALSAAKARTVAKNHTDSLVLGADTIVVIDGLILGKPQDRREAIEMLSRLSGRRHEVFTGFSICFNRTGFEYSEAVRSVVEFHALTEAEIAWYTATCEPYDKAGAYALQGKGALFVKEIEGSYTNVIGLPLREVIECLRRENYLTFSQKCR